MNLEEIKSNWIKIITFKVLWEPPTLIQALAIHRAADFIC
jgi:hypothetical protein